MCVGHLSPCDVNKRLSLGRLHTAQRSESQTQREKDSSKGKQEIRSILCPKPKFVHNRFSPSGLYKFTDKRFFLVNNCVIHYAV